MSFHSRPVRRLTDPHALRALAHPVRLALLELLYQEGPLTATQASELTGESPASCSFHLRTLARYGYLEEADGGRGRQRPWRVVPQSNEIPDEELDSEAKLAGSALLELLHRREEDRQRGWLATRHSYPQAWRSAANEMHTVLHLTAPELAELGAQIQELVARFTDRDVPAHRPTGSLPVTISVHAFPLRPPAGPAGADLPTTPSTAQADLLAVSSGPPNEPAGSSVPGPEEA